MVTIGEYMAIHQHYKGIGHRLSVTKSLELFNCDPYKNLEEFKPCQFFIRVVDLFRTPFRNVSSYKEPVYRRGRHIFIHEISCPSKVRKIIQINPGDRAPFARQVNIVTLENAEVFPIVTNKVLVVNWGLCKNSIKLPILNVMIYALGDCIIIIWLP